MLILADVIEALTGHRPGKASQVITDAVVDSRQAIPGALFVAVPGEKLDGHDFIEDSFERGGFLALIHREVNLPYLTLDLRSKFDERLLEQLDGPLCLRTDDSLKALQKVAAFWRKKLSVRVIGITGSVGKTTTKEVVAEVLSAGSDLHGDDERLEKPALGKADRSGAIIDEQQPSISVHHTYHLGHHRGSCSCGHLVQGEEGYDEIEGVILVRQIRGVGESEVGSLT